MNSLLTATVPFLPRWIVRPFALPYVAGETIDEALQAAEAVSREGFSVTLDILGEHTLDVKISQKITEDYCSLYNLITQKNLDCTISLKLTHLGLDISKELAAENLNKIIISARPGNRGLTIDMENSSYTSQTLDMYKTALEFYENTGTVLQAYLHRSMDDLKQIMSPKLRLRICKGIYLEDGKIAFKNGNQINENYIALCQTLLKGEGFVEIATHDTELIHDIDRWISENHIPMDRFEFQVLYGVPMGNTLENLKDKGYRVRVYIPFGDKWYEYSIRRLKENPNIVGYVLKNMFKRK
ncbi:MAG TPA: proline dehydrogenase family protein [Candidatus Marinimicrobia bacterium]|nr:proline dehydrogenase family protein [Candidatus Neomarinimicrobiota bacterium]